MAKTKAHRTIDSKNQIIYALENATRCFLPALTSTFIRYLLLCVLKIVCPLLTKKNV